MGFSNWTLHSIHRNRLFSSCWLYSGDNLVSIHSSVVTYLFHWSRVLWVFKHENQTLACLPMECSPMFTCSPLECSSMARETWVQSQVKSYQRLEKSYLMPPCFTLSIIRYGSRVEWSNPEKEVSPSRKPWCSSYWKGSLQVTLNCSCQLYLLDTFKQCLYSLSVFLD